MKLHAVLNSMRNIISSSSFLPGTWTNLLSSVSTLCSLLQVRDSVAVLLASSIVVVLQCLCSSNPYLSPCYKCSILFLVTVVSLFTMLNVSSKLYHRYVCIGKNIVYVGFGTIHGFRHPLGGLKCILPPSRWSVDYHNAFLPNPIRDPINNTATLMGIEFSNPKRANHRLISKLTHRTL